MRARYQCRERGFTLVELLITVVIIAILTAIAVPAYISVVARSQDSAAKQELSSVNGAQDIAMVKNAGTGARYLSADELRGQKLLQVPDTVFIGVGPAGQCFTAVAESDSGKWFWIDSENKSADELTSSSESDCVDLTTLGPPPEPTDQAAFSWSTTGGNATVTGFSGTAINDIVIPSEYELGGTTYTVTSVGALAFNGAQLTSLTIPDTVTSLGQGAFRNNQIASLSIGNSVVNIGPYAFEFNNLTSVTIPGSVTQIGREAFNYNALTSVTMLGPPPTTNGPPFGPSFGVTVYHSGTGYPNPWSGYATSIR